MRSGQTGTQRSRRIWRAGSCGGAGTAVLRRKACRRLAVLCPPRPPHRHCTARRAPDVARNRMPAVRRPRAEVPERARLFSPIADSGPGCPPTMLIHGAHDRAVPVADSRRMLEMLRRHGVPAVFVELPMINHAFDLPLLRLSPPAQTRSTTSSDFWVSWQAPVNSAPVDPPRRAFVSTARQTSRPVVYPLMYPEVPISHPFLSLLHLAVSDPPSRDHRDVPRDVPQGR